MQRELGQERFTRLVRHAYDRGIRFFETADAHAEMHEMLAIALRGIPRDSYRMTTKYRLREPEDPKATIDRFRKELGSEYFDVALLHCVRVPDWADRFERLRDARSEAKQRKVILAHPPVRMSTQARPGRASAAQMSAPPMTTPSSRCRPRGPP